MSSLVAWAVYDNTGAPLPGLTPSFVDYCDRSGTARTPPTIVDMGGGLYGFFPSDADEATGTLFLVDNGLSASQRRMSGPITTADKPFTGWHLEDATGALWTGAAPTVGRYASIAGPLAAPSVVSARTYLFSLTPSSADMVTGVSFRVDSASGAWPPSIQDAIDAVTTGAAPTPPAVLVPSTVSQAQQGVDTPILWADYQEELAPPWLRAGYGSPWLRALGDVKDAAEAKVRDAVKARMPDLAPLDGLGRIANERGLEQGVTESTSAFRARLKAAWDVWPWAGTALGVLRALWYAGFTNAYLITGTGQAHGLDISQNLVTVPYSGGLSLPSGFWNSFRVVFPAPLKASWVPTLPGNTSDEVNTIRRLVKKWKAGHALFEDMVVISAGFMWGFPPSQQWGGAGLTWGGTTTTWTPD